MNIVIYLVIYLVIYIVIYLVIYIYIVIYIYMFICYHIIILYTKHIFWMNIGWWDEDGDGDGIDTIHMM